MPLAASGCGTDGNETATAAKPRPPQNTEAYRIRQDCVSHGGIQGITPEFVENAGDSITAYFLVVCKDGSGPWTEVSDEWRAYLDG